MKLLYEILMKITKETLWFILFRLIQNDTGSVSTTVNRRWQRAYNSS